jgi:predicted O-methyltransferase YrrM
MVPAAVRPPAPSEGQFTQPSPWCPEPGWWHAEDGDATELEVTELVAAFVRALQPEVVAETGAYTGQTSAAIGQALLRNGHGRLHSVEIDPVRAELTRTRCEGLPVEVITGDSLTWDAPDGIGFAWIDGGADRTGEVRHLLPRFAPGALLGMHDMSPRHQVREQTAPLIGAGHLIPVVLHTPRGVMFAEVHP